MNHASFAHYQMTSFPYLSPSSTQPSKKPVSSLPLPRNNTPSPSSHRRKLRLVKKTISTRQKEPIHKASVDDYDKERQVKEEPIVYPLITYDPGLLDLALVIVTLSQTQTIRVCLHTRYDVGDTKNTLPAPPADGAVESAYPSSFAHSLLRHFTSRGQAMLTD